MCIEVKQRFLRKKSGKSSQKGYKRESQTLHEESKTSSQTVAKEKFKNKIKLSCFTCGSDIKCLNVSVEAMLKPSVLP